METPNKNISPTGDQYYIFKVSDKTKNSPELFLGYFFKNDVALQWLKDNRAQFRIASLQNVMMSCYNNTIEAVREVIAKETAGEKYALQNIGPNFRQFGDSGYTSDIAIHFLDEGSLTIVKDGINMMLNNEELIFPNPISYGTMDTIFSHLANMYKYSDTSELKSPDVNKFLSLLEKNSSYTLFDRKLESNPNSLYLILCGRKSEYALRTLLREDKQKVEQMIRYLQETEFLIPNLPRDNCIGMQWNARYNWQRDEKTEGQTNKYMIFPVYRDSAYSNFSTHLDGGQNSSEHDINHNRPIFWLTPKEERMSAKIHKPKLISWIYNPIRG
jgi:hypothetical protein